MKANELMIGDWVYMEHTEDGVAPYEELTQWTKEDFGFSDTFIETHIYPVPLTPEILEQNFEKKTFYGIFDDYFDLDIREYSDSVYVATFHNCEMNTPDQQMTFSFVHELQHFLSHCCIEKEIEL